MARFSRASGWSGFSARAYDAMISAVTLQDLKQAAATWLTRAPFVITALPAATPQETAR